MERIINRQIDSKEYNDLLQEISAVIDRCVDFGGDVFSIIQKNPRGEYVDSSISLILRDFLELLDGVSTLVKSGCFEAAVPLLRSMFEHMLYILYILDKHQEDRAASYHVGHIKAKLASYSMFEQSDFLKDIEENTYSVTLPDLGSKEEATAKLEELLLKGKYKVLNEEWIRTKKKNKKSPEWYSLFGGPKNLYELSKNQRRAGEYKILYKYWSTKTHGNSALNNVVSGGFKAIRHPESINMVGTWSLSWTFVVFLRILRFYQKRKQVTFGVLYMQIRNLYSRLSGKDLIKIIYEED